jgi:hypothetical protein
VRISDFLRWLSCQKAEITSLNCGHQRTYSSSPRWYMSVGSHGGMMSTAENWFVYQSSLAILPAESSGTKQEKRAKGMMNLAFRRIFYGTCKWFVHAVISYDIGPPALVPLRRKACCGFLSPLKVHRLGWVWPREPWSNGRHANCYTAKGVP